MDTFKFSPTLVADLISSHGNVLNMVLEFRREGELCRRSLQKDFLQNWMMPSTSTVRMCLAVILLSPAGLMDTIPIGFFVTHVIDPVIFPGIAKYLVDDWDWQGAPMMTQTYWINMRIQIAAKYVTHLNTNLTICEQLGARLSLDKKSKPTSPHGIQQWGVPGRM